MARVTESKLELIMHNAKDYAQWRAAAIEHDVQTGKDQWRHETETHLYDYQSIERRLKEMRQLRKAKDHRGLLYTLNQGIHGNLGGMGSSKLYRQSRFGTKDLITDYIAEIEKSLWHIAESRTRTISFAERLEFFHRADHCFGQSALMLSGGASLAHFHLGVAKALSDEELLPSVISGSSGGSFVAGILGTHTNDELHYFFDPVNLVMETTKGKSRFSRMLTLGGSRMDVDDLESALERTIPDVTFAEAYEISGRWINISIAPYERHQSSRLLNAITSPNVYVRKAVMASCAIPGIYPPVTLEAKSLRGNHRRLYLPQRKWIDGSMSEDMPVKRLSRLYGVNHFIASQVNPLVLWILQDPKASQGLLSTGVNAMVRGYQEWLRVTQPLTHKLVRSMPKIEYLYRTFYALATQEYSGDITITPRSRLFNPARLLSPLTEKELLSLITDGRQTTYPKIEMIRNCTKISRTLQEIVADYDRRSLRNAHKNLRPRLVKSGRSKKPAA